MFEQLFRIVTISIIYILNIVTIFCSLYITYMLYIFYDKCNEVHSRIDYVCDLVSQDKSVQDGFIDINENKSYYQRIKNIFISPQKYQNESHYIFNYLIQKYVLLSCDSYIIYEYIVDCCNNKVIDKKYSDYAINILLSNKYKSLNTSISDFLHIFNIDDCAIYILYISLVNMIKSSRKSNQIMQLSEISKILHKWLEIIKSKSNKINFKNNKYFLMHISNIKNSIYIRELIDYTLYTKYNSL